MSVVLASASILEYSSVVKASPLRQSEKPVEAPSQADLAGALHEVSNALTVVLGWLDAARPHISDPSAREAIEVARAHADLGHRLAREAIGAEVPPEIERRAASIARDAVLGVMQEAKRAAVSVEFDEAVLGNALLRDGASALQILVNLLLNAIAFSPPGAQVRLTAEDHGDVIGFRVADQGPGVPADRADSILSGPSSTRRGGAGIGLTHSATLASDKGGRLRLIEPGPGAVFELSWPVIEDRSGPYERPEPISSLEGTRVVLVEDDANVLSLVEMTLEVHGVQVVSVTCPEDLVDLLANGQTFDAAFVDFSPFENENSTPALESLTRSVTRKGIILISGLVRPVPPVLEAKVAQWVRKPFEMSELVTALRRVIDAG